MARNSTRGVRSAQMGSKASSESSSGVLHVVSTPIGNLEDVTSRAVRVLREADLIVAEDTRRTAGLLARYGIQTSLLSCHAHNEHARAATVLEKLEAGARVALVSDAGTPLLSDPGALLVAKAIERGIRVEAVPGPSAILAALVTSGLTGNGFTFLGFPPSKATDRRRFFETFRHIEQPLVMFEAPHRLVASLRDLLQTVGDRRIAVSRELTKLHEEHLRGRISEILEHIGVNAPRGEFTIVVEGLTASVQDMASPAMTDELVWEELGHLTRSGLTRRQAVTALGKRLGRPARDVYAAAERGKAATSLQASR
jgi:16S rRNA (cytidine1402-2'-O)-methyltransferase